MLYVKNLFSFIYLQRLCAAEIPKDTSATRLLQFGSLPDIVVHPDNEFCSLRLDFYAGTYLREEVSILAPD